MNNSLTVCCEIVGQFPCIILASPFLQLMAARREGAMLLVVRPRFAAYTLCNTLCIIIIYNHIGFRTKAFHVNCQTILSIDTSNHITTCYTLAEDIRAIVLLLLVRPGRVVETLNKKSHQGDAMGGRNPPTTVMATNNNCQKKLFLKSRYW